MRTKRKLSIMLALLTAASTVVQVFVGVTTWGRMGKARTAYSGFEPGLAFAQVLPTIPPAGAPGFGPLDRGLDQLNLSTEQRASIDALVDAYRQQSQRERQSMMMARWALMQAVVAETVDTAKISEAAVTVWELELDVAVRMAELLQEIRAQLTPDQKRVLRDALSRPPTPAEAPPRGQGS